MAERVALLASRAGGEDESIQPEPAFGQLRLIAPVSSTTGRPGPGCLAG